MDTAGEQWLAEIVSNLAAVSYFGNNHGADESFIDKDDVWHLQYGKGFAEEKGDGDVQGIVYLAGLPLSFTMENGLKVDVGYAPPHFCSTEGVFGTDFLISSGCFEAGEEDWGRNMTIGNPGALAGVDIDEVHYDLVKEAISE